MSRVVIETKTGEIQAELKEGDRIISKNTVDFLKAQEDYQIWRMEKFYKGNIREIKGWLKDLTVQEKAFLFSIVPFIGFDDCCLKFENGVCMTTLDLIEETGLPRCVIYRVIQSLIKKDILYKGKNSKNRQFFINPWLFCVGKRVNLVLKTMFQNYKIKILGGKKWKEVE